MYRYVTPKQRPGLKMIAGFIAKEHPLEFEPQKHPRQHVSILSKKSAMHYLRPQEGDDTGDAATELLKKIYRDLPDSASKSIFGKCTQVDYLNDTIVIILNSPEVSSEINFAYDALGVAMGRQFPDRRPHISIGELTRPGNLDVADNVLATAVEACSTFLPEDRQLLLGPVSLRRPSR